MDKTKYSPSVSYNSLMREIAYIIYGEREEIEFTEKTSFQVFDKYGNLIKKGYSNRINIDNIPKDTYYMNYGNTFTKFNKK